MARITVPEGPGGELVQVWGLSPELGAAVGNLSAEVYGDRLVAPRVREVARMKIAQINGCAVCVDWRFPELAERGVDEALYDNVADPARGGYSTQELLAIEYAEILELTVMIGSWLAFGRLNAVLDVSEACAWAPRATV